MPTADNRSASTKGRNANNLKRMAYFAAVVETGSFTAAAERLGITKAVVSQQVAKLEQAFGTTLLIRTTRRVRPTEEGMAFHESCSRILSAAQEAFDGLASADGLPTGRLRLTSPVDYGIAVVIPALATFQRRFPAYSAELVMRDDLIDQVGNDVELAIRVGWLTDSDLRARRIGTFRQIMVAGPAMADRFAASERPDQLPSMPFVANANLRDPLTWTFRDHGGRPEVVRLTSVLSVSATLGVLEAVRCGVGISVLPDFAVASDLASGRLVRMVPDWMLPDGGIYAVMPTTRFRPARVSSFLDVLEVQIAAGSLKS